MGTQQLLQNQMKQERDPQSRYAKREHHDRFAVVSSSGRCKSSCSCSYPPVCCPNSVCARSCTSAQPVLKVSGLAEDLEGRHASA